MSMRKLLWVLAAAALLALPLSAAAQSSYDGTAIGVLDGNPTNPSYGYVGARNTGWYRDPGSGNLRPSVAGTNPGQFGTGGFQIGQGATGGTLIKALTFGTCSISEPAAVPGGNISAGQSVCLVGGLDGTEQVFMVYAKVPNVKLLALQAVQPVISQTGFISQSFFLLSFQCISVSGVCGANTTAATFNYLAIHP